MKKVLFTLVAMVALVFTGCKVENANVTVTVEDEMGLPVPSRYVFYCDWASAILDVIAPSPEELLLPGSDNSWEYESTNAMGVATIKIPMAVSKMKYRFIVFEEGSSTSTYQAQDVEIHRGQNEEIKFVVKK